MIKGPQTPPDDLDRLLSRVKRPEPPAWFEARLMARMLREKELAAKRWWGRPLVALGALSTLVLIAGISLQASGTFTPGPAGITQVVPSPTPDALTNSFAMTALDPEKYSITSDQKITDGLNAFMSYSEEEELWSTAAASL